MVTFLVVLLLMGRDRSRGFFSSKGVHPKIVQEIFGHSEIRRCAKNKKCQGTDVNRVVCGCPLWSLSCSNFLPFIGWCWSLLVFVCSGCCTRFICCRKGDTKNIVRQCSWVFLLRLLERLNVRRCSRLFAD